MAITTIKAVAPKRVPQPSSAASFVLGSRPGTLRDPGPGMPARIKPMDNPGRDYGKPKPAVMPPFGGSSGLI